MILRRFSFLMLIRLVLIATNMVILTSIFGDSRLFFNQVILGVLLVVQFLELIRFSNQTNRELTKFFDAIRQSDFTITISKDQLGRSYAGLFESMRLLVDAYKKVKVEEEAQFQLLQQIIEQVPTGIILVRDQQEILLMNEAGKKILGVPAFKNWNHLSVKAPSFASATEAVPGQGRYLVQIDDKHLSLDVSNFQMLEHPHTLYTFKDIQSEMEQNEINAWHKLIRILTHEIMNSVTPIASLSETVQLMLEKDGEAKQQIGSDTVRDVLFSTKTIHKRSEGLLAFVEDYRKLTRVPKPDLHSEDIGAVVDEILELYKVQFEEQGVRITNEVSYDTVPIDRKLIAQVLVNLVKNSLEAVQGIPDPHIHLSSQQDGEQYKLFVEDNGPGIDEKDARDIWVPFFTTKPEGSGIGLSLCRQIMKLHRGNITFTSTSGKTTFTLQFGMVRE